jgi:tetratricopeptide (TPR) repeat protein
VGAAAAVVLFAPAAQAAVSVFGGGDAQACSLAAATGAEDQASERVCTDALEKELLSTVDRAGTYVNRGIIKLRRGAFEAAKKDFDTSIRYEPKLAEAYVNRGATLIGMKRYKESVADLTQALKLDVKEPHKAYYDRGLAYEMLDDRISAQVDFQAALELAPDWMLVKNRLARYGYYSNGKTP